LQPFKGFGHDSTLKLFGIPTNTNEMTKSINVAIQNSKISKYSNKEIMLVMDLRNFVILLVEEVVTMDIHK
jgi:hypothetical protein